MIKKIRNYNNRLKKYKFKDIPLVFLMKLLIITGFYRLLPGKLYLQLLYRRVFGEKLNIDNPQTFNEKLQWLKLYDRNPEYTKMADKALAKEYVSRIIGNNKYIIPTLGIWNTFDDINFDELPDQFVLKCTHDSGSVYICKDKATLDIKSLRNFFYKALKQNIYYIGREWCYKNIKPRLIAEKYLVDESGIELKDYKFFCFDGQVKYIQVDFNRFTNHKRNIYDTNWQLQDFKIKYSNDATYIITKPNNLNSMISLASTLSKGIAHLRVDLYCIKDKIYFGELTFYHGSGTENFLPEKWNRIFGSFIQLPEKRKESP